MSLPARLLAALLVLAPPAHARSDPAESARIAMEALEEAAFALEDASKSSHRIEALTQTVQALESGLEAVREGLRQVAIREAAISGAFDGERDRLARLLGVLQAIGATPAPATLVHPQGPVGAARAGMLVSSMVPALQQEADALRARLEELARLRALQEQAASVLAAGLASAQGARTALSQAMSDRVDLPRRYTDDPEAMAALAASVKTLESFATALADMQPEPGMAPPGGVEDLRGRLALPVNGRILHLYLEPDAAGIDRPGLVLATRPLALVTAPAPATIRYVGPLLDYGNVAILEPGEGVLMVLAGLDQVFGRDGEVIAAGDPVGLMGGAAPQTHGILISAREGGQSDHSETLYIEIRENGAPVDPLGWFAVNKD